MYRILLKEYNVTRDHGNVSTSMGSECGGEVECAVRQLRSSGKVQNIKGNALVADLLNYL